jgi:Flp pilus assembly protein TadG
MRAPRRGQSHAARRPRSLKERGQAIVEFSLALPVLLLLLLGTIDMGQMFFQYIQLRGAVREAAAAAARTDCATAYTVAQTAVISYAPTLENSDTAVENPLTYSGAGCPNEVYTNSYVTVKATSEFTPLMADFWARIGLGPFTMHAEATARVWT